MTVTSVGFLLFLCAGAVAYYIVPKRAQWGILLALSLIFYACAATPCTFLWIIISALSAWISTNLMVNPKIEARENGKKIVGWVTAAVITGNVLLWFFLKGSSFWNLGTRMIHRVVPAMPVLGPLPVAGAMGMGYYTAQVIAYIMDCYWENCVPHKNFFKVLLLTCFFPQMMGGPISRHNQLEPIYESHSFSYEALCLGSQRILWGFFKKLVISDRVGLMINGIWNNPGLGGAMIWLAVFLYPLQIYTDFSGMLDIVLGAAEIFGIHLPENFRNPFFARTVQEFWQRWHITLGTWAKDYVYYPVLKSRNLVNLGKWAKKRYPKRTAKLIPWTCGMAVLWFVMGFWHGSVQHILGVSLWFFTVLVISEYTAPTTKQWVQKLKINEKSLYWHIFQSVRTYFLYALGVVWFSADSLSQAVVHYKRFFRAFGQLGYRISLSATGATRRDLAILLLALPILFLGDLLRENHGYAREWVKTKHICLRWVIWVGLFLCVLLFGMYGEQYDASGFIYQVF